MSGLADFRNLVSFEMEIDSGSDDAARATVYRPQNLAIYMFLTTLSDFEDQTR